jgi:hypothetical protein
MILRERPQTAQKSRVNAAVPRFLNTAIAVEVVHLRKRS